MESVPGEEFARNTLLCIDEELSGGRDFAVAGGRHALQET